MHFRRSGRHDYALLQENVPLEPDFPIRVIPYSEDSGPIRSLHCHDVLEFGICLQGQGVFVIDFRVFPYRSGDLIAVDPGIYHRAKSSLESGDMWHYLHLDPALWTGGGFPFDGDQARRRCGPLQDLIQRGEDAFLADLVLHLAEEVQERRTDYHSSVCGLIRVILARFYRFKASQGLQKSGGSETRHPMLDPRISRALDRMINLHDQPIEIPALAKECSLSVSHFRELFKAQIGCSPKQYLTELKIRMVQVKLLESRESILRIAGECGFESLSSLNRQFKRATGLSPSQWRREQRAF